MAPLLSTTQYGHAEVVRILITAGADVNIFNKSMVSALDFATRYNHEEVRQILLASGAEDDPVPPLHEAVYENNVWEVGSGLARGAKVDEERQGFTPLRLAAQYGHIEVARLLLERKPMSTPRERAD